MGVLYARVGGAWQAVGMSSSDRWNNAWGAVGTAVVTTGQTGISNTPTDITGLTVTFAPVVGRRYKTVISAMALLNTAGRVCVPQIADAANVIIQQRNMSIWNPGYFSVHVEVVETFASTAAVTRKARIGTDTSGGTIDLINSANYPAFISVEDVGPVAGAVAIPNPTPAWITLPLLNGFTALGAGYTAPGYRIVGDVVQVRGTLTRSGSITSVVVAQLPVGYRPAGNYIFSAWMSANGAAVRCAMRVLVDTSGQINFDSNYGMPTGTTNAAITGIDHLSIETQFSVTT